MNSHLKTNSNPRAEKSTTCGETISLFAAPRTNLPVDWIWAPRVDTASNGMTYPLSPTDPEPNRLWTTHDLAKFLKCSERQIARLRDEGMPTLMIGALVRFSKTRVMEWLEGRLNQKPLP
jgi:excisionase family DNA binding protein